MADISAGALRFDITADNGQFMTSMRQAQQSAAQAADTMGKKFEEAGKQAQQSFDGFWDKAGAKTYELITKVQDLGKKLEEAFSDGAAGVEKITNDFLTAATKKAEESWSSWIKGMIQSLPVVGNFLAKTYELVERTGIVQAAFAKLWQTIAGATDVLLDKIPVQKWTTDLKDGLASGLKGAGTDLGLFSKAAMDKEAAKVDEFAQQIKTTLDEWFEGIRTTIKKWAGLWEDVSEAVQKAVDRINSSTRSVAFNTSVLGMDAGAKAEATAKENALKAIGKSYDDLNSKEKALLDTAARAAAMAAIDDEARRKYIDTAEEQKRSILAINAALDRQGDIALANIGRGYGKSAFDRAMDRGRAMAEAYGRGKNANITDNAEVKESIRFNASKEQIAAEANFTLDLARALKEQVAANDLKVKSLGASVENAERMKIVQAELNKAEREGIPITDELRASIEANALARGRSAGDQAYAKFMHDMTVSTREQVAALDLQILSLDMSAGRVAQLKYVQTELNKAQREGIPLTEALFAKAMKDGRQIGDRTDAEKLAKSNRETKLSIDEQVASLERQTQSLGLNAGEVAKLQFIEEQENKARRDNVVVTEEMLAKWREQADILGIAKQRAAEATERFENFRQVGQTVASSLENAFSQWISGTHFRWKEFITSLEADLAKLAFKKGIESLFVGTSAQGGGIFGDIFRAFGGFKAEGGAVGGGTPYIVGERGPELFVPQGAGTIVPNHAIGGGGNTTIAMSIDLKGANGDETIARISAMAARQAAVAAIEQANQGFPGRSRSYQLLEG